MTQIPISKSTRIHSPGQSPLDSQDPVDNTLSSTTVSLERLTASVRQLALRCGIVPDLEWEGQTLRVHISSQSILPEAFSRKIRELESANEGCTITLCQHHQIAVRADTLDNSRRGLSHGSQVIRALRARLGERYGDMRRWRVSEDYQTRSLVLFYSGSQLKPPEEASVRELVQNTTTLPVRIERRLNQALLAAKIMESKPQEVSASSPAFYDERFAVIRVPRYEPGSAAARASRSWQVVLHRLGRRFGVGIVLRSSGVSNAFFRILEDRAAAGAGLIEAAAGVLAVRKSFFPDPPESEIANPEPRPLIDLPFVSFDPIGRDNMPFPGDTLRSEADPEDIVWAGRRADGGFRVVIGIYDISGFVGPRSDLLEHAVRFGQSFYSPFQSYPLLGPDIAFSRACFQQDTIGDAFAIELEVSWDGQIESSSIYEARMKNHAHLSYSFGDAVFNGERQHTLQPVFDVLRDFATARRAFRRAQWDVQLDSYSDGTASGFSSVSSIVIEEAMTAAKYAVGRFFSERGVTAIHRVYGQPSPSQQKGLIRKLAGLGITAEREDFVEPRKVVALVSSLRDLERSGSLRVRHESRGVLNDVFSWLQFGASYSVDPKGHAGLSLDHYSPIKGREAAGVVNQLLLRAALQSEASSPFSPKKLHAFARLLSRQEDLYGGRLYGLVYLQALEFGIELASGAQFEAIRKTNGGVFSVPRFSAALQQKLEEYPGLIDDLQARVIEDSAVPDSDRRIPVAFVGYDIDSRRFLFHPA